MPIADRVVCLFPEATPVFRHIARSSGLKQGELRLLRYPAGELRLSAKVPKGCTAVLLADVTEDDGSLFRVTCAAEALRRAGASRVELCAPWVAYGRQDRSREPGECAAGLLVAGALARAFDAIVTMDPHSAAFIAAFEGRLQALRPEPLLLLRDTVVVAPDAGARIRAMHTAQAAGAPCLTLRKHRSAPGQTRHLSVAKAIRRMLDGRSVLLVDDLADSGGTLEHAAHLVRNAGAGRVAIDVSHAVDAADLRQRLDGLVTRFRISYDHASGRMHPVAARTLSAALSGDITQRMSLLDAVDEVPSAYREPVRIPAGSVELEGTLDLPEYASGLVVFIHGSGSDQHSPRNALVAAGLTAAGIATLRLDLLTPAEQGRYRQHVFDIPRLAKRVDDVLIWVERYPFTAGLPLGLASASTGTAAAIDAVARTDVRIRAIVSRGGRPDLAQGAAFKAIKAPTLFLVGGADREVLQLTRRAMARMSGKPHLQVIPGATHLFEEAGSMEQAARASVDWFARHFR